MVKPGLKFKSQFLAQGSFYCIMQAVKNISEWAFCLYFILLWIRWSDWERGMEVDAKSFIHSKKKYFNTYRCLNSPNTWINTQFFLVPIIPTPVRDCVSLRTILAPGQSLKIRSSYHRCWKSWKFCSHWKNNKAQWK